MSINDSTNETTVRRLYSVLSGLAAKISNAFVKKNASGYIDRNDIPVMYASFSSERTIRVCRFPAPSTLSISVLECFARMNNGMVKITVFVGSSLYATVMGPGVTTSTNIKFYYRQVDVDGVTYYDILANIPAYYPCLFSPSFLYDRYVDMSYFSTTAVEIAQTDVEIPFSYVAYSSGSSNGNLVKIGPYGELSEVDFMSSEEIDDLFDAAKDAAMSGQ
jgi:hypothetical protein